MTSKVLVVRVQNHAIATRMIRADTVIGEALGRVEVEDPKKTSTFKGNDLIAFMLPTHICLKQQRISSSLLLHLAIRKTADIFGA